MDRDSFGRGSHLAMASPEYEGLDMNSMAPGLSRGRQLLRALLVEDDDTDARIVVIFAEMSEKFAFELTRVRTIDMAREALTNGDFDLCLLDYWVGHETSLRLLTSLDRPGSLTATVVLSNISVRDVETLRIPARGAYFLSKGDCSAKNLDNAVEVALNARRYLQG
jgi:DNA-binding NtrC family response regulator